MCFRTARGAEIDRLRIGVVSKVSSYWRFVRGEILLFLLFFCEVTKNFDVIEEEIFKDFEENLSWRKER